MEARPDRSDRRAHVGLDAGALERPASRQALVATRVTLDLAAIAAAALAASTLRFRFHVLEVTRDAPLDLPRHLGVGLLWAVALFATMASHRLYDEDSLVEGSGELNRVRRAVFEGIAIVSTAVFLLRLTTISRGWFAFLALLSLAFLWLERVAARAVMSRLRAKGKLRRPALVVTARDDPVPDGLDEFDVVASLRPEHTPVPLPDLPVEAILIDERGISEADLWRLVLAAGEARIPVFVWSPVRGVARDRVTMRELDGRTIVKVAPPRLAGLRGLEKRAFDLVVSAALLVLLVLPMAAIAGAVLATSGRPVLHRQQRVGLGGRPFTMWKFRTMRPDAEPTDAPGWTVRDDPRRTRIGAILRRLGLDELPQLWNVLRGDMSLVGPRPERPLFVARFNEDHDWYRYRHRIRPGITGLAQVRGHRGDTALGPRIEADNWYIEHWSLGLDLKILARTLGAVLRGENAY